ncbi:MAG: RimK family protein [Kiritimatiellae bacterium]|nr:RimK family protein [Kiritimatiellia bacterium]
MNILLVVEKLEDWPLTIGGVEVITAKSYLTDQTYTRLQKTRVYNLCRSYRYQQTGYYVSLLAAARGHRPIPDVSAMRDMQTQVIIKLSSEDIDALIQQSLSKIQNKEFILNIYFGHNLAKRYDRLSTALFNQFRAPLLRAKFACNRGHWGLAHVTSIALNDVPDSHRPFLLDVATRYFSGRAPRPRQKKPPRFFMGMLLNPADPTPPSNEKALKLFERAAEQRGIDTTRITKEQFSMLPEFDALFIRETTSVTDHTFRFARRAEKEGLIVIDDPLSILRCTNKVYLAEALQLRNITIPKTLIVHRDNIANIVDTVGLPCILKKPDSSYSQGVHKADTEEDLMEMAHRLLEKSDLVVAQEFLPTPFDWRVGIIDNEPFYICKYFMAENHWQIVHRDDGGKVRDEGYVTTIPMHKAPLKVIKTAVAAAKAIGNGLYGVDLKQIGSKVYVIEVNDNPSIDAGVEDQLRGIDIYGAVMDTFLARLEARYQPPSGSALKN